MSNSGSVVMVNGTARDKKASLLDADYLDISMLFLPRHTSLTTYPGGCNSGLIVCFFLCYIVSSGVMLCLLVISKDAFSKILLKHGEILAKLWQVIHDYE